MPSKNEVKIYVENGYYHIYNRGVEKRSIYIDQQDYAVFLSYLKTYLLPKAEDKLRNKLVGTKTNLKEKDKILKLLRLNNFHGRLTLLAYTLMPNHFHFLIRQTAADTIHKFMNSLATRYSMYFNRRYKRVGPLFQGLYKAVFVETEEQLLHLSRYIHYQAYYVKGQPLQIPQPSSYLNYLGKISQEWLKPDEILAFFKSAQQKSPKDILSYQSFVETYKDAVDEKIASLVIESF